jgi:nicotinate-nucleotide adenylyltransferase
MRIGLFGGAFDPVHLGHLIVAERCREEAALDRVWFLPSYKPPHKTDRALTRFEHRIDLVTLATTGQPAFAVEPIEKELPPPNYTAHTLSELRQRHPADDFFLILGADSVADLPQWYEPKRVVEQAGLLAVPRPGSPLWTAHRLAEALGMPESDIRLQTVACPLIEIASRELRQRVAEGKSIRFLVPRAVEEFIRERGLYRT